jgi:hypothetical protein
MLPNAIPSKKGHPLWRRVHPAFSESRLATDESSSTGNGNRLAPVVNDLGTVASPFTMEMSPPATERSPFATEPSGLAKGERSLAAVPRQVTNGKRWLASDGICLASKKGHPLSSTASLATAT